MGCLEKLSVIQILEYQKKKKKIVIPLSLFLTHTQPTYRKEWAIMGTQYYQIEMLKNN
jgi:hypothetical protein